MEEGYNRDQIVDGVGNDFSFLFKVLDFPRLFFSEEEVEVLEVVYDQRVATYKEVNIIVTFLQG